MAWIDRGSYYEWDVPYTHWPQAVTRSQELAHEYGVATDVLTVPEGENTHQYLVITQYDIGDEHSIACRCEKCLVL